MSHGNAYIHLFDSAEKTMNTSNKGCIVHGRAPDELDADGHCPECTNNDEEGDIDMFKTIRETFTSKTTTPDPENMDLFWEQNTASLVDDYAPTPSKTRLCMDCGWDLDWNEQGPRCGMCVIEHLTHHEEVTAFVAKTSPWVQKNGRNEQHTHAINSWD